MLIGSVKINRLPFPTSLSTQISSSMQFHKLLGQCQPKSSPFFLVSIVAPYLAKFLEDRCLIIRGDPDPGVSDRDLDSAIDLPGANSDPSSLRSELHGVGKKVEKDLFDLALVADEVAEPLVHGQIQCYSVGGPRARAQTSGHFLKP